MREMARVKDEKEKEKRWKVNPKVSWLVLWTSRPLGQWLTFPFLISFASGVMIHDSLYSLCCLESWILSLSPRHLYPMFIDSHLTKRHAVVLHVSTAGLYGWLSLEVIFVPQPTASKHSSSTLDHFDVGMSDPRDEKRVQDKAVDGK